MGRHGKHEADEVLQGRRQFTVEMALALLGGAAVTIGCGGGGPSSPGAPTPVPTPSDDEVAAITGNHGHEAVITGAQLRAGNALTLNITGPHVHVVELSADEVARIRAGEQVVKTSTKEVGLFGLHDHQVLFN